MDDIPVDAQLPVPAEFHGTEASIRFARDRRSYATTRDAR